MLFNSLDPSVVGDYLSWVNLGTTDTTMNPARSRNDGSVMRVSISTGVVETIAGSLQGPMEVFVTADAVYWYERVANDEGRIVRLAF